MKNLFLLSVLSFLLVNNTFSQTDSSSLFVSKDGNFFRFTNNYVEFKKGDLWGGGSVIHKTKKKLIIKNDITYSGNTKSFYRIDSSQLYSGPQPKFIILNEEGNRINVKDIIIFCSSLTETLGWAELKDDFLQIPDNFYNKEPIILQIHSHVYFPLKIKISRDFVGIYMVTLKKYETDFSMMYLPNFYKKIKCKCVGKQQIKCAFFGKYRKLLPYEVLSRSEK